MRKAGNSLPPLAHCAYVQLKHYRRPALCAAQEPRNIPTNLSGIRRPISIRLLQVLPNRRLGRIQVRMRTATPCFSNMPDNPDGLRDINLDSHCFKVRRNLFDFLDRAAQTFPHQLH